MLVLARLKAVLPLTHILERSMSMFNLHKPRLLHNLKPRLLLLSIVTFLVFAGPAVTLQENTRASGDPAPPPSGSITADPKPLQQSCPSEADRNRPEVGGRFDPVINLPLVPVHLSVLPDGRVLFWGRDKSRDINGKVKEVGGRSEAYVWNISDGSNKTDVAVYHPANGTWYIINSSNGSMGVIGWGGLSGDVPVPGDYDGDGKADAAIFRPSEGNWYIRNSSNGSAQVKNWGVNGDVMVPGDYDGDGKTDVAVYHPANGTWYIINSSNGSMGVIGWGGLSGDVPVPGDYDGDGKTDAAIFRPSEGNWYIRNSSNGSAQVKNWGVSGDVPVLGDYNGDGRTDIAVYHPSNGTWYILNIATGATQVIGWGLPGDVVAPGDYDGDGKTDAAIFRPSEGNWYIRNSSDGSAQVKNWGVSGDVIVPKDYDGMLRVANSTTNLFCSGHSFLPDGRLLVAGGHKSPDFDGAGEPYTNIFDYLTNSWSRGPDMNQGRWYPYNVTLNTGETLIMAGLYWSNFPNANPTFATNLVPQVYTSGGSLRNLNQPVSLTVYPFLHLTPDGKVFQAQSGFIPGASTVDHGSRLLDPDANQGFGEWTYLGGTLFPHAMGTSVLFDSGRKALLVGGFNDMFTPTREAEFIDLKPAMGQPTWTPAASMNFPRTYHTATILPNGKVLVTGGVSCTGSNNINCPDAAAMIPEMWDPTANPADPSQVPWCKMADQKVVRAYHSVAALLPDGRVLVGGGGLPGAVGEIDANGQGIVNLGDDNARLFGHKNVEIYSPPYLFDSNGSPAVRPIITSVPNPASVSYGQTFFVGTSGAGASPKVSLVRLASVTHGFNQDQRHIFLTATLNGSSGLNVTAPADSNKCPPGYYMLFVLNSNGVPSVSKIIRVLNTPAYEGYVDGSDCNQIWGWAWDRSKPNQPINVDIYDGASLIATVSANLFRQDVYDADKGNGYHAFFYNFPSSLKDGLSHSISVKFSGTSTNLNGSPRSIVSNGMLFPAPSGTITAVSGGGATWEQAVQFSSSVNGTITHIRFYKAPGETGTHIGRIWSDSGALLVQVPFPTPEAPSGWHEVALATPLQIIAGVKYRVSYNVNSFGAKILSGLSSPISNGPLTAWTGFYTTPSGTFPNTGSVSNFLADVRFCAP